MARKKKARHHVRRHKMSGIGGSAMKALYIGAGAIAGEALANALTTMVGQQSASNSMSNLIPPGGVVIAGIFLPKLLKGDIGEGIGAGMVAVGTLYAAQNFGVIAGVPMIAGNYSNKPVRKIGAWKTPSGAMVSGMPVKTAAALEAAQ